jgi:murein L,D-transpeptidase YcbB/YkuD
MMRVFALAIVVLLISCGSPSAPPGQRAPDWRTEQLEDLQRAAVEGADGLRPPAESVARLAELQALPASDGRHSRELDEAASDLFRQLAEAHARGAVDPAAVDADWHIERPGPPDYDALNEQLAAGALPSTLLRQLGPNSTEYIALRTELRRLQVEEPDSPHIPQLRANLERWRWLARALPTRRIEVRIAEYALVLHRPDQAPQRHAVIVGARRTPTPIFAAETESVTLNPSWTPPRNIVLNELVPRFSRDPAAAAREGYDVLDASGRTIDPTSVNWSARPFRYQLRQRPGAGNALGRIRFDLPNPFAVYLHDTPNKDLFTRDLRALSHGCVRVEAPVALAAATTPAWTEDELRTQIEAGATRALPLPDPMPVYFLYLTTGLTPEGEILYLDDIYGRDQAIVAALDGAAETARLAERGDECAP